MVGSGRRSQSPAPEKGSCWPQEPSADWAYPYVQASRSQKSTHLFADKQTAGGPALADLIRSLAQERQKTMAQEVTDQERQRQQRRERGISL